MRRSAVTLYASLKKYNEGIAYAIKNRFYDEASSCAAASENGDKCETMLRMICSKEFPDEKIRKEIFTVAVSRFGKMVRADVVLELAWRFNMIDFAMPYLIGHMRSMGEKIIHLEERVKANELRSAP
jgi:clathrin heavy chain